MFSLEDALYAASVLGVSFDKFTVEDFLEGIVISLRPLGHIIKSEMESYYLSVSMYPLNGNSKKT